MWEAGAHKKYFDAAYNNVGQKNPQVPSTGSGDQLQNQRQRKRAQPIEITP